MKSKHMVRRAEHLKKPVVFWYGYCGAPKRVSLSVDQGLTLSAVEQEASCSCVREDVFLRDAVYGVYVRRTAIREYADGGRSKEVSELRMRARKDTHGSRRFSDWKYLSGRVSALPHVWPKVRYQYGPS